jgi:hypothetical protein
MGEKHGISAPMFTPSLTLPRRGGREPSRVRQKPYGNMRAEQYWGEGICWLNTPINTLYLSAPGGV